MKGAQQFRSFLNSLSRLASPVTSASLATTFTLSTAGIYTIGVFRISLVEPDAVKPTVFQLQGSLVAAE